MSLQKKVVLSFCLSALIIALLSGFLYLNFVEIKKETVFLELTDTIRSKSLQLRRHEKNYFLYAPDQASDESRSIYRYLAEMKELLEDRSIPVIDRTAVLRELVEEYQRRFRNIETQVGLISQESEKMKIQSEYYRRVSRLIEANFLDRPLEDVAFLSSAFSLLPDHPLLRHLTLLNDEISALRKTGESILTAAKDLDGTAREKMDGFIRRSRIAILLFFPLFLMVGFGAILAIVSSLLKRLRILTDLIEKTGAGELTPLSGPDAAWGSDEVGQLIVKFNRMEEQLLAREKELLQTRNLASIGTFASGVAHELNNPLSNIYTSAQRLMKKAGSDSPEHLKKGLNDIFSQAMRVKVIVADLLEFARGREPHFTAVELQTLVRSSFRHVSETRDMSGIRLIVALEPPEIVLYADPEQLERLLINLFSNAADAMRNAGDLTVSAGEDEESILLAIADTGCGIPEEAAERLFEPFFTTKDQGTGLGLAIVFNIVRKHGGQIRVKSTPGAGAAFIITLPKRPKPQPTAGEKQP